MKLKTHIYIEASKKENLITSFIYSIIMVRVVAEMSINSPTASSCDRYKYRYGCGQGSCNNNQRTIYRRPSPPSGEKMSQKHSEKQPLPGIGCDHADHDIIYASNCDIKTINDCFNKINETVTHLDAMSERQQISEMNQNSEKEKQREKEKEKEKLPEINRKLGKIIYRSRTGDIFEAQHSIHTTVLIVVDKKTKQSTKTDTQKIVWNDRIFETKQDWFHEMAKISTDKADENMQIVRCE